MAGKDRKRQIARERYEKRMAARAQARAKAKRRTAVGLSAGAVIAIVAIVLLIVLPSNSKKAANLSSPAATPTASASATASASIPPVPTTASGCTSKPSVVASPIANFPILPAGVDAALKTEPIVTIPSGAVPTKTQVKDIVVGTGATVGADDSVTVNYLGLNYVDCLEFDSSWSRDTPATFSLDRRRARLQEGHRGRLGQRNRPDEGRRPPRDHRHPGRRIRHCRIRVDQAERRAGFRCRRARSVRAEPQPLGVHQHQLVGKPEYVTERQPDGNAEPCRDIVLA